MESGDLHDLDAGESAQRPSVAARLEPVPITVTTAESVRASSRVARADPAAVRVAVM
jgi:hypothetical protein